MKTKVLQVNWILVKVNWSDKLYDSCAIFKKVIFMKNINCGKIIIKLQFKFVKYK